MADALDPRLLRVSIEIHGQLKQYTDIAMTASGTKFAGATQNECEVKLTNLDKVTRDYLLTETSPFNKIRTRKRLLVEAGRVSTGYSLVFSGDITNATGGQPPDITITLKAAAGDFAKGQIIARSLPGTTPLRAVAGQVAKDLGLSLNFQAESKHVSNWTHTGSALGQVAKLGQLGRVNAYVDDKQLIVKPFNVALKNQVRELNLDTGMIGIPEFTETGIKVRMLFDNRTVLGGGLRITSKLNPAADGTYTIAKLAFELSNRDTPFYFIAEAVRPRS